MRRALRDTLYTGLVAAAAAVALMIALALHEFPHRACSKLHRSRSIILEAADGQELGRKGPIRADPWHGRSFRSFWSMQLSPPRTGGSTITAGSIRAASHVPSFAICTPAG